MLALPLGPAPPSPSLSTPHTHPHYRLHSLVLPTPHTCSLILSGSYCLERGHFFLPMVPVSFTHSALVKQGMAPVCTERKAWRKQRLKISLRSCTQCQNHHCKVSPVALAVQDKKKNQIGLTQASLVQLYAEEDQSVGRKGIGGQRFICTALSDDLGLGFLQGPSCPVRHTSRVWVAQPASGALAICVHTLHLRPVRMWDLIIAALEQKLRHWTFSAFK